MTTRSADVQAQVDALLLEHGAFAPLEYLFATGRLLYADFAAWRRGEFASLDPVLMGRLDSIRAELEQAGAYARALGLTEESLDLRVATASERALRASADRQLAALLARRYLPARSAVQMDLFFDNPIAALIAGIAAALAAANAPEATRLLDTLYATAPNHPDLSDFDRLLAAVHRLSAPVTDTRDLLQCITSITASAHRLLGSRARELLGRLWRHLAAALPAGGYSPREPLLHASHAWSQAHAWEETAASVLAEPCWWHHGPLALRLTASQLRRRHWHEGLSAWFQLCWNAADEAAAAAETLHWSDLYPLWQAFLDLEVATLDTPEFPAWILLSRPALGRELSIALPFGDSAAETHYRLVHRWLAARAAGNTGEDLALRRELQVRQPGLFACLLRSVTR
jgi:hypothetical protein